MDADSGPLVDWDTNTAWIDRANPGLSGKKTPVAEIDKGDFPITSSFILPALGCWEVHGHFHGEDLRVVIDVTRSTVILRQPLGKLKQFLQFWPGIPIRCPQNH